MSNTITIATETRRAVVPATIYVRAWRRTSRALAMQAALAMLHAWGTGDIASSHANLTRAADETLAIAGVPVFVLV